MTVEPNHTTVAQIMPPQQTMTAAQALNGLAVPTLTSAQATAWLNDSKSEFGDVVRNPWPMDSRPGN